MPDSTDDVVVAVHAAAPVEQAWTALTDPGRLAQWLGAIDVPMRAGAPARLDFGDGDFFDIEVDEVDPPRLVRFRWRFLGLGPESAVTWRVARQGGGSMVSVADHADGRVAADTAQLAAGWRDFFGRLQAHLRTGTATRYRWRSEIDGGVVLPDHGWQPIREDTVMGWLPIALSPNGRRTFYVVDGEGPRGFLVEGWRLLADTALAMRVAIPGARTMTRCEVAVEPVDAGRYLRFSHTGWASLGLSDLRARSVRHRFAAAWTEALRQAATCAGGVHWGDT